MRLVDLDDDRHVRCGDNGEYERWSIDPEVPAIEKPHWIPCNERLPEKAGKYLVTVQNGNVYAGTFDKYSGRFQCAAIAWMPLPEPYGGEG